MLLAIDYLKLTYTCIYLLAFILSYYVIIHSRLEELFKKGKVLQIRIAQVLISLIAAYFITAGIQILINSTQF